MPFRPNFTALEIDGDTVLVRGLSAPNDPEDFADIVDIRVVLVQGDRVHPATVDELMSDWVARVPVQDPGGTAGDFGPGDAVVFGVETRRRDATTITWTQHLPISPMDA
jgi:hypothetical protein